jgi:DNA polymerase-1
MSSNFPALTQDLLSKLPYHKGNSINPKYIFIGVGPGKDEFADPQKRAFIGYSGKLLDEKLINGVGIHTSECYYSNVLKERIPDDAFDLWIKQNPQTYATYVNLLRAELELVAKHANIIIPLGDVALRAVCKKSGITNWRGSILPSAVIEGKKCVPTIHPASILRDWTQLVYTRLDFQRIKEEAKTPDIKLPKRTYIIRPDFDTAIKHLQKYLNSPNPISVDIETFKSIRPNRIVSIQFADSSNYGFCLPFQYRNGTSYWSVEQEVVLWKLIYIILTTKRLIGQNFVRFDTFMLHFNGIPYDKILNNVHIDTMEAFQCLQPQLPKSLGFLASIYTREPFYKAEGKEWDSKTGEDEFWTYGCKDACITYEIAGQIEEDLKREKLWEFYLNHFQALSKPRMKCSIEGLPIDIKKREELLDDFNKEIIKNQCKITILAGSNVNVGSNKQMCELMYDVMKLQKQYKQDKKGGYSLTCDEDALLTLSTKSDSKIFQYIIEQRSLRVLKANNLESKLDSDGRIRTSFGFVESGRLSSAGTPLQTGTNLQNWQKRMRIMIVPPPGYVIGKGDLSQAEARIVAWRARSYETIQLFLTKLKDIHILTAAGIFNKPYELVTADERYSSKRTRYGFAYGMHGARFAKTYNKDAAELGKTLITVSTADFLIAKMHEIEPTVKENYWREIQEQLQKNKTLYNFAGRRLVFHDRLGDDLYRAAYSIYAQSTVADLINMIWLKAIERGINVVHQNHDELVWFSKIGEEEKDYKIVQEVSQIPIDICSDKSVPPLVIPIDVEFGANWYETRRIEK